MPKKNKTLRTKIFQAAIQIGITLLVAGVLINFFVFSDTIAEYYRDTIENTSSALAAIIDNHDVKSLVDEVKDIYYRPGDAASKKEEYARLMNDSKYQKLVDDFFVIKTEQNMTYVVLVTPADDNENFIYIVDADSRIGNEISFSYPGDTIKMDKEEKQAIDNNQKTVKTHLYAYDNEGKHEQLYSGGRAITDDLGDVIAWIIIDINANTIYRRLRPYTIRIIMYMAAIILISAAVVVLLGKKNIIEPLNKLSTAARKFIDTRKDKDGQGTEHYFKALGINTEDELEEMAKSMSIMENELNDYEKEIVGLTKENERIHTELSLAAAIQNHMLPGVFPPFPERKEIDLFALMDPAREVGGDFYDLFMIDEDHLVLVVADVSGKGIPASLFMMVSKILVKSVAKTKCSAGELLERVNNQLCENDREQMFVTVWIAIVNLKTGMVNYANAGHENPMLYQDGKWSYITTKHGLVLSAMPEMKYQDHYLQLQPGDWLFQYSDGVPEATDENLKAYGMERLTNAVNKAPMDNTENFLNYIKNDVETFVNGSEQFDDITMLAFQYRKKD